MDEGEPKKRDEVEFVACEAHQRTFELLAEGIEVGTDFLDAALTCEDCRNLVELTLAKRFGEFGGIN